MSRNQATSLTMVMGGVYLTYSAYFLSTDFGGVSSFMKVIHIIAIFIILGYYDCSISRVRLYVYQGFEIMHNRG